MKQPHKNVLCTQYAVWGGGSGGMSSQNSECCAQVFCFLVLLFHLSQFSNVKSLWKEDISSFITLENFNYFLFYIPFNHDRLCIYSVTYVTLFFSWYKIQDPLCLVFFSLWWLLQHTNMGMFNWINESLCSVISWHRIKCLVTHNIYMCHQLPLASMSLNWEEKHREMDVMWNKPQHGPFTREAIEEIRHYGCIQNVIRS